MMLMSGPRTDAAAVTSAFRWLTDRDALQPLAQQQQQLTHIITQTRDKSFECRGVEGTLGTVQNGMDDRRDFTGLQDRSCRGRPTQLPSHLCRSLTPLRPLILSGSAMRTQLLEQRAAGLVDFRLAAGGGTHREKVQIRSCR